MIFRRSRTNGDRIDGRLLEEYGRIKVQVPPAAVDEWPLASLVFGPNPVPRQELIAELARHAEQRGWRAVGAWKFVTENLGWEAAPEVVGIGIESFSEIAGDSSIGAFLSVADRRCLDYLRNRPL